MPKKSKNNKKKKPKQKQQVGGIDVNAVNDDVLNWESTEVVKEDSCNPYDSAVEVMSNRELAIKENHRRNGEMEGSMNVRHLTRKQKNVRYNFMLHGGAIGGGGSTQVYDLIDPQEKHEVLDALSGLSAGLTHFGIDSSAKQLPEGKSDQDINFKKRKIKEDSCVFCGADAIHSKCEQCVVASYCCREHQLEDWDRHKHLCFEKLSTCTKPELKEAWGEGIIPAGKKNGAARRIEQIPLVPPAMKRDFEELQKRLYAFQMKTDRNERNVMQDFEKLEKRAKMEDLELWTAIISCELATHDHDVPLHRQKYSIGQRLQRFLSSAQIFRRYKDTAREANCYKDGANILRRIGEIDRSEQMRVKSVCLVEFNPNVNYKVEDMVIIHSVKSMTQYNGLEGNVVEKMNESGRVGVMTNITEHRQKYLLLKPANLLHLQDVDPNTLDQQRSMKKTGRPALPKCMYTADRRFLQWQKGLEEMSRQKDLDNPGRRDNDNVTVNLLRRNGT